MKPRSTICLLLWFVYAVTARAAGGPIEVLVPDGCWTWFNDERVIVLADALVIGSMDRDGASRVDVVTGCFDERPLQRSGGPISTWRSRDDHNNPALLRLADGRLLAAYTKHHLEPVWYRRSATVYRRAGRTALDWGPEVRMEVPARATYNNLFQLSQEKNRLYNFIRCVGFNPNVLVSDDGGRTWSAPVELIRSGGSDTRPYVKYFSNGRDRIDFLYTDGHPRREPTNSVYHLMYQDGAFRRSDGTVVKQWTQLAESPLVPADGTRIYDGREAGRGWVWDFEYDPAGQPVAVFINAVDGAEGRDLRYRYARWSSRHSRWTQGQIAYAGTHLYVPENHYAGGICLDPEDVNTVYLSADVDPRSGQPLATGHYQIFRGHCQGGGSWQWTQLTDSTDVDNIRPVVPREHGCRTCVLWLRGHYRSYTDYETAVVGLIEPKRS